MIRVGLITIIAILPVISGGLEVYLHFEGNCTANVFGYWLKFEGLKCLNQQIQLPSGLDLYSF